MDNEGSPEREDPYYRTYVEHRNKLYELQVDQTRALDNAILTLAGGAIGISFLFLEKFANPEDKSNWWILYAGWIALVASIILTMLSFLTSAQAIGGQIQLLDSSYREGSKN